MQRLARVMLAVTLAILFHGPAAAVTFEVEGASDLATSLGKARHGDRIHLRSPGPAGGYQAPPGGWRITQSIEIFGDATGRDFGTTTVLRQPNAGQPVLVIDDSAARPHLQNIYIHDLTIAGAKDPGKPEPGGYGIQYVGSPGKSVDFLRLARLEFHYLGDDAIHLDAEANIGFTWISVTDCSAINNYGHGLVVKRASGLCVMTSTFFNNWKRGVSLEDCTAPQLIDVGIDSNNRQNATLHDPRESEVALITCPGFLVTGSHFENFNSSFPHTGLYVYNCFGGYVGSCSFGNDSKVGKLIGARGIYVNTEAPDYSRSSGIVIGPNTWAGVDTLVSIKPRPEITSCTVFPQAIAPQNNAAAKLAIPEGDDLGHVAYLPTSELSNVTAGVMLPRIKQSTRDAMRPAANGGTLRQGLLIFNTTSKKLNVWDGKGWREIADTAAP
jgi:hypothetical protein